MKILTWTEDSEVSTIPLPRSDFFTNSTHNLQLLTPDNVMNVPNTFSSKH
jgi:hypothetical protein